uniref:Reverse transcriptase domain-containing protein n=1 Tax=Trichuris muris TaxID=70415 RepID=A0A5S6QBA6_TRIMR
MWSIVPWSVSNPDEEEGTLANNVIPFTDGRSSEHDLPTCFQQYADTIRRFARVFTTITGTITLAEHQIWTRGSPVKIPPRRIPERFHAEVRRQLQAMLDQGIIERNNSPWMAPAVYTLKPSGEVRIFVDYRELNVGAGPRTYPYSRGMRTAAGVAGPRFDVGHRRINPLSHLLRSSDTCVRHGIHHMNGCGIRVIRLPRLLQRLAPALRLMNGPEGFRH